MSRVEVPTSVFLDGSITPVDIAAICGLVDDLADGRHALEATSEPDAMTAARRTLVEHDVWNLLADEANGTEAQRLLLVLAAVERLARAWPALALSLLQSSTSASFLDRMGVASPTVQAVGDGRPVALVDTASRGVDLHWSDDVTDSVSTTVGVRVNGSVLRLDPCGDAVVILLDSVGGRLAVVSDAATRVATPRRITGMAGSATLSLEISCAEDQVLVVSASTKEVQRLVAIQRVGLAVIACAIASKAADAAAHYVQERVQFNRALVEFPVVRDVRDHADVALGRAVVVVRDSVRQLSDPAMSAASIERTLTSVFEDCLLVADTAVQLHGGYGYLMEYGVERHLRDLVSLRAKFDMPDVLSRCGGTTTPRIVKEGNSP